MGQTILITGGTGSWGQAMTRHLLTTTDAVIRILSRDELKQTQMQQEFGTERVRYLLGDVRDYARLVLALDGVETVFHAAALKHVPMGEYNPSEFIHTNIHGTENVIRACQTTGVEKAVFLSTDKAVNPVNLYGATKMVAERLWIQANSYSPQGTAFMATRYGNVAGSRGSVIPLWRQALADKQTLRVTSLQMSRFWMTLKEAVAIAWFAASTAPRGTIVVPHLPAYTLRALMDALWIEQQDKGHYTLIGIRPGEKLAEELLTPTERYRIAPVSWASTLYYLILPEAPSWEGEVMMGQEIPEWPYRSDTWSTRLTVSELCQRLMEI